MAFVPLALALLPLVPQLIDSAMKIVQAARSDPATPEEMKGTLDALDARLTETSAAVAAVRFRELPEITPEGMPPSSA